MGWALVSGVTVYPIEVPTGALQVVMSQAGGSYCTAAQSLESSTIAIGGTVWAMEKSSCQKDQNTFTVVIYGTPKNGKTYLFLSVSKSVAFGIVESDILQMIASIRFTQ